MQYKYHAEVWYRPHKQDGYWEGKTFDTAEEAIAQAKEWQAKYNKDFSISVQQEVIWAENGTGNTAYRI